GRAQTPLSSQLLCTLVTTAHGNNIRSRREVSEGPRSDRRLNGARLRHFWPCGKDRRARFNRYFRNRTRRCRSSVVEHPLGKGEVVSSILTGSTRKFRQIRAAYACDNLRVRQQAAERNTKIRTTSGKNSGSLFTWRSESRQRA